ncbi:DUF6152 family protein [Polaromonas sp. DSR2-3-2]|uniref:DUF6152 family protein n=1 Tax=unclassified Polaromonas TaxID=2638319 RepID=UPI003CEB6688
MKKIAFLSIFLAAQAFAHYGWNEYDTGHPLELAGSIEESGYVHPHGVVKLKTADKTWTVVLAPPSRMQNRGLNQEMLAPGKRATAYGYPNRNNPGELRAERITIDGKTTELR